MKMQARDVDMSSNEGIKQFLGKIAPMKNRPLELKNQYKTPHGIFEMRNKRLPRQ